MNADKKYYKAGTVAEAIALADQNKDNFRFLAGGTDLLVNKFHGHEKAECLIDLSGIEELKLVEKITSLNGSDSNPEHNGESIHGFLKIGSLVSLDELDTYSQIKEEFPVLVAASRTVASPVIRKTATIGGNLLCENRCVYFNQSEWWREAVGYCLKCNGDVCIATGGKNACFSKFVSDTAPALISLNAMVEIVSRKKSRRIKLEDLYSGDGVAPRKLKNNEIITSILIPLNQQYRTVFKKLRQRESLDFSSLTTCVSVDKNGKIKAAIGGVDPAPVVVESSVAEKENLIKTAIKKARIVDNDVFSRKYRKEMISVFLERSLHELFNA